jgi:hypothetical protein
MELCDDGTIVVFVSGRVIDTAGGRFTPVES